MKDRIAKSIFWIVWSKGAIQLISGLSTILVARWLSPRDYGLMAMAGIWTNAMVFLSELGLGPALVQFRNLDKGELNACFWLTTVFGTVGYFILFCFAPAISDWFGSPELSPVLRVAGIALPLIALRVVPDSLLRKQLALDKISQAHTAASLATIIVVISMAWKGWGVWALVAGTLIQPLVHNTVIFWFVRWWPGIQIRGKRLTAVLRYSSTTLGGRLCWSAYSQADALILGKLSGDAILGLYSFAKDLALLPATKISVVVNQLAFPIMAELQDDPARIRLSLMRGLRLVSSICFPMSFGMALVAEDLFQSILTEKWLTAVPIFQVLCLYACLKSIDVLLPPVLLARYRPQFLLGYTMVLLIVMSVAFWVGASWWGGIGLALTWVVIYPMVLMVMVRAVLKEIDMEWYELLRQIAFPLLASVVMGCVVLTTQLVMGIMGVDEHMTKLISASFFGALSYGVCLFLLGGTLVEELKEISKWVFRPGFTADAGKQV